jgi:hypothetical protein
MWGGCWLTGVSPTWATAEEKLKTIWQKILDDKEEPGKILGSVDG